MIYDNNDNYTEGGRRRPPIFMPPPPPPGPIGPPPPPPPRYNEISGATIPQRQGLKGKIHDLADKIHDFADKIKGGIKRKFKGGNNSEPRKIRGGCEKRRIMLFSLMIIAVILAFIIGFKYLTGPCHDCHRAQQQRRRTGGYY